MPAKDSPRTRASVPRSARAIGGASFHTRRERAGETALRAAAAGTEDAELSGISVSDPVPGCAERPLHWLGPQPELGSTSKTRPMRPTSSLAVAALPDPRQDSIATAQPLRTPH